MALDSPVRLQIGWNSAAPYVVHVYFITMHLTQPARLFKHNKGRNAWDLLMADNGTVLLTQQAYWNSGCKILLFVNRGIRIDGGAE